MRETEKKIKQANWGRDARLEAEKRSIIIRRLCWQLYGGWSAEERAGNQ